MKFCRPNLPQNAAALCIVSGTNKQAVAALEKRGISCCITRPSPALSRPVAAHADMLALLVGPGRLIVAADQRELIGRMVRTGAALEKFDGLRPGYPQETALNALLLGDLCIGGATAVNALNSFETKIKREVVVKQGYARCSAIPVTETALITADKGIADAAQSAGLEVLLLEQENKIQLPGYQHGFLGGCCGKLSAHELAFCGDFEQLEQHRQIREFLQRFDVEPLSLTKGPMQDIGGILVVAEADH